MTRTVNAVRVLAHGEPLRVQPVPLREPGPDEVVVDLVAAGVNPVDRYGAEGRIAPDGPLPRTLGAEGAGWLDGRPVLVTGEGLGSMTDGTWAQAATVPRSAVTQLPESVDLMQASSLGIVGITALNTVSHVAQVTEADRVLVLGGAGGVGLSIISMALAAGARVVAQVGTASKEAVVRECGAEAFVADALSLAAQARDLQPTVVFDPLGGEFTSQALTILAPRGRHVIFGVSAGPHAQIALQALYRSGQRILGYGGLGLSPQERREGARAAVEALGDGRLRVYVGRTIALSEAADVLAHSSDRSLTGNLVIDCTR